MASAPSVAVIGVGCWYPGARSPKELWENILARRQAFRRMPDVRLPLASYHHPDAAHPDTTYGERAALIDGFVFDWAKRRIPKTTVDSTDVVHWLALETALASLGDAGVKPETLDKEKTGVIVGNSLTGEQTRATAMRLRWPFVAKLLRGAGQKHRLNDAVLDSLVQSMEAAYKSAFPAITEDTLAGGLSNTIAGRICNYLDLHGGGYTVDGACSSSLLAVATAAQAVASGELDVALAGGVDVSLDTFELIGFAKTGALTREAMRVYDRGSSGFIPGEGCGFVVLKDLEKARRDGNRVYAVVRGWGISSDGKGGITAPSREGQATALRRAYAKAGYTPSSLTFIEGHGTGTKLGDKTEIEGIGLAMGPVTERGTGITSVKSLLGHTKAAAGIAGFIKATLALNRRVVPPTASCREPNPAFETAAKGLYPVLHGRREEPSKTLRAGVSAMGFGGINCHVTLESGDAPDERLSPSVDEGALLASAQETEVFVLAAPSAPMLLESIRRLQARAQGMAVGELADLSHETFRMLDAGGAARAAVVAGTPEVLLAKLEQAAQLLGADAGPGQPSSSPERDVVVTAAVGAPPKIGFLFPGQGSQQLNMARRLVERFDFARELLRQVDGWRLALGSEALEPLLFKDEERASSAEQVQADKDALAVSERAQSAICFASMVWLETLRRLGVSPSVVAGHSLGELTAFFAAGAFDAKSLVELATIRGRAMATQGARPGTMASLACGVEQATALCMQAGGYVVVANINSPNQVVISGEVPSVEQAIALAAAKGIVTRRLAVANAFHSKLVDGAAAAVGACRAVPERLERTRVPVLSTLVGRAQPGLELRKHFAEHVLAQVDFVRTARALLAECDLVLEVGPGRALSGLVSDLAPSARCLPVEPKAGQDKDFNLALAELHVRGVRLSTEALFKGRLVRPFRPAAELVFIDNPCERPTVMPEPTVDPAQLAPQVPASLGGVLDASQLGEYFAKRGRFLAKLIEADLSTLGELPPAAVAAKPAAVVAAKPAAVAATPAPVPKPAPVAAPVPSRQGALAALIELVAARTGFPKDSIPPTARMVDDLALDSIKGGEILAAVTRQFGMAGELETGTFANAKLQEIAEAIDQRVAASLPAPEPVAATRPDALQVLMVAAASRTGFPAESLAPSMHMVDDLHLDSIKSSEVIAAAARELGVSGAVEPSRLANATLAEIAQALSVPAAQAQAAPPPAKRTPYAVLLEVVQRISGFGPATLSAQSLLEGDLRLTSERAHQVLREAAGELGLEPRFDVPALAMRPLGQIAEVLGGLAGKARGELQGLGQRPPHTASWVRDFQMALVPEPLAKPSEQWVQRSEDRWPEAHCLVVHEPEELEVAEALAAAARARGARAELCTFEGAEAAVKRPEPSVVVTVFPRRPKEGGDRERLAKAVARLRVLSQLPPSSEGPRRRTTLVVVQFGGGSHGKPSLAADFDTGCAGALAASLHLERSDLRVRVVDLATSLPVAEASERVLDEVTFATAYQWSVHGADGVRRVPVPQVLAPARYEPRGLSWSSSDVVVVTGGARGITAECALAFGRSTGARLALLGSSPAPTGSGDAKGLEIARTLERFEKAQVVARYFQCDIADPNAVQRALAEVARELGPVTGVVHGAGLNHPRRFGTASAGEALAEIAPKLLGALNLLRALEASPPKLVVALTSIIGVTGMPGNAWYAYSNEALDVVLGRAQARWPGTQVASLAFSVWGEVGMGSRMGSTETLAKRGIAAIPTEEGVQRFLALVHGAAPHRQTVIAARLAGLDTWRPARGARPQGRYLEEEVLVEPGVEAVFRAQLGTAADAYVKDHVYKGSFLFPTVFGLEAMAQVVAAATGRAELGRVRLEDVRLERPIVVDPEHGCGIEISAVVVELGAEGGPRVAASIRCEQSGYRHPHFSAVFCLGLPEAAPTKSDATFPAQALPLEPKKDLYGPVLFQGPSFQRLERVWQLEGDRAGKGRCTFSAREQPELASAQGPRFVLGDPYFRDALLQVIQLTIPQDVSLPVSIDRIEIRPRQGPPAERRGIAVLEGRDAQHYFASVAALDEAGGVLEQLDGYRLRILEHRPQNPTAAELAAGTVGTERLVRDELAKHAEAFGLVVPELAASEVLGLPEMSREQRRSAEVPTITRAVHGALKPND